MDQKEFSVAEICFKTAKNSLAWHNLGSMYARGVVNGTPDYTTAAECYEKAEIPEALHTLTGLCEDGHLAQKNDGAPNYDRAKEYYERANLPKSWKSIGWLYEIGHIGAIDSQPDYAKAAEYYEKAKTPEAWHNLGNMYRTGLINGTPDYAKDAECYEKSNTLNSWHCLALLYFRGHVGRTVDGTPDYAQALVYISHTVILGGGNSETSINLIFSIIQQQEMIKKLKENNLATSRAHSEDDEVHDDDQQESSDTEEDIGEANASLQMQLTQDTANAFQQELGGSEKSADVAVPFQETLSIPHSLSAAAIIQAEDQLAGAELPPPAASSLKTTSPMTRAQKIERAEKKHARALEKSKRYLASMESLQVSNNKQEPIMLLTINFINQGVQAQYNAWSMVYEDGRGATTLPELMKDIQANPSGTYGMGKPEVLRRPFMGHKGCLSRRIGGEQAKGREDRVVYKVTGPAEITVIAVGGHYE